MQENILIVNKLGLLLNRLASEDLSYEKSFFQKYIDKSVDNNEWFTKQNIIRQIKALQVIISEKNLNIFLNSYQNELINNNPNLKIGIIMAGNIPLVGFADLIYVLLSGNRAICKLSSKDKYLLPCLITLYENIYNEKLSGNKIIFTDFLPKDLSAVIATGSNNSSRYFEYFFKNIPIILRKHRTSIAILTGNENNNDLEGLCDDITSYFGLGCRNVSKLLLPPKFNINIISERLKKIKIENCKLKNNYKNNKALFEINGTDYIDTDNLLLYKSSSIFSPLGTLSFDYYNDIESVENYIESNSSYLQCIVGQKDSLKNFHFTEFGNSQFPLLSDYADDVDIMKFLFELKC